jgi:hypothetical protein
LCRSNMGVMTRTAYLRIYQPLSSIEGLDDPGALGTDDEHDQKDLTSSKQWLLRSHLPSIEPIPTEGAFTKTVNGELLVCPWRTRLRMLAGLLAFRGSVPDEVAEAFVGEEFAHRAAHELAELEETHPEMRNHIIHANWHVPLRWFAAFEGPERILTEDRHGLRVRYEVALSTAKARLLRAHEILESSWIDDQITGAIKELVGWLDEFPEDGLIELDYGSVAGLFEDEDLLEDHSAAEVWTCLEALETGDVLKAGRTFSELTERWSAVRAMEVVN